jgi:predicted PurR-regulated permease PerM
MERNALTRAVLVIVATIGVIWLLGWIWDLAGHFSDIILPFFLAWLLAFVLYPLADTLAKAPIPWRHGPRPLSHGPAVALVYLGLILVFVLLGVILIPMVVAQVAQLGTTLPQYVGQLPTLSQLQVGLNDLGIPVDLATVYQPQAIVDQAKSLGGMVAQNALGIAAGVASGVLNTVIILILSFYFMLDGPRIERQLLDIVPGRYQGEAAFFTESITKTFGGFIRGQLLQALIYGTGTAVVMWLAGLQFVAAVSSFSGLAMIIPFIGPLIAIVPPVALAAVQSPGSLIGVLVALVILQQIVTSVIAPKIMSETVGIHPLLVLFAMLVGVKVAGFWGALFGVPVVAVIYATTVYMYQHVVYEDTRARRHQEPTVSTGTGADLPTSDATSKSFPDAKELDLQAPDSGATSAIGESRGRVSGE